MKTNLYPVWSRAALFLLSMVLLSGSLSARQSKSIFRVTDTRCENLVEPVAIDNASPHFSWVNLSSANDEVQIAYEIEVATNLKLLRRGKADVWRSGRVADHESVMVPYGGQPLPGGRQFVWRVRTWNKEDECSRWSAPARFGTGLLNPEDFQADYIMSADAADLTPVLMKKVRLKQVGEQAILHVNSLGYHELYVNGRKVGHHVLTPAVSQLDRRSQIVSYDVRPYLHRGTNTLVLWLGQGWYKPTTFKAAHAGPVVRAQLDVCRKGEWEVAARTDGSWQYNVSQVGAYKDLGIWLPEQFVGEQIDASRLLPDMSSRTLSASEWAPVSVVEVENIVASPQMFPGNTVYAELAPQHVTTLPDGKIVLDFGRNITGWLRTEWTSLEPGTAVKAEYADDKADDGTFAMRGEHDIYISAGTDGETFCNKFNHHAFRYVVLSGAKADALSQATALHIAADVRDNATFECSDEDINAIHQLIQHTVRCLSFSGYMVDCPHIERQGYGGDGNSSTLTLQTMQDASSIYYNWLQGWADVQEADGGLPHVAPTWRADGGGPYWCGFIIQAPWRTFLNYGDDRLLRKHYENMQRWLGYVSQYSPDGLLERWPDVHNRTWYLGDWLAPYGVDVSDEQSVQMVSNCFVCECLQSMQQIATHLDRKEDAARYAQWHQRLSQHVHEVFYHASDSTYASASPLDLAYALNAGVVPDSLREAVNGKLVRLSRDTYHSHIAVGLVGVAVFTEWAIRHGEAQLMYDIMKQPDYPGFLYMLHHGATTTWEAWNGDRSHIHNCYNGIGTWFYQALAGIRPDADAPGYHHFTIEPQMPQGIDWVKATQQTPYGEIRVSWQKAKCPEEGEEAASVRLKVSIPMGSSATVRLLGKERHLGSGTYEWIEKL